MEQIVIVDENDNFIGEEDKEKCHDGAGILHRAFLAMVFNKAGELLLARRSETKRLWPGFWDGTVASHLFRGEDYRQASRRRLLQEMGLAAGKIEYLFKFHYRISYKNVGAENEICAVTVIRGIDVVGLSPNRDEISDVAPISVGNLIDDLGNNGDHYTPWLALAMGHLRERQML